MLKEAARRLRSKLKLVLADGKDIVLDGTHEVEVGLPLEENIATTMSSAPTPVSRLRQIGASLLQTASF